MALTLPDDNHRFRCGRCGNLTRFDVVRDATTKEFWHSDMSGDVTVETSEISAEKVLSVTCRWCGATDEVEIVLRPAAGGPDSEPAQIG
ncbi:MAG: hypothetical protein RLZZ426_967 [Actinomycetota bacterium]